MISSVLLVLSFKKCLENLETIFDMIPVLSAILYQQYYRRKIGECRLHFALICTLWLDVLSSHWFIG